MTAITDETATEIFGPKCESCEWRQRPGEPERHRPAMPGMGVEACPEGGR